MSKALHLIPRLMNKMEEVPVRPITPILAVAMTVGTLLAGCSNGTTNSTVPASSSAVSSLSSQTSTRRLEALGVPSKFWNRLRSRLGSRPASQTTPNYTPPTKELAVTDVNPNPNLVEILNGAYKHVGTITGGSNEAGDYIDVSGNLYVADGGIDEYNSSGSKIFTYPGTTGQSDDVDVAVDSKGNVYAADYAFGQPSVVVEYAQGSTTPIVSCSTGLANLGITVRSGAVFVAGNNASGTANIIKYPRGLVGCKGTTLGVSYGYAGGLKIDRNLNLIACDQANSVVDIIPPPYTAVSSTISVTFDPVAIALNATQNTIYIADLLNADVQVNSYPGGSLITTLGSGNGLGDPAGVAFHHTP